MPLLYFVLICVFPTCVKMMRSEEPSLAISVVFPDESIILDTTIDVNYTINGTIPIDFGKHLFLLVQPENRIIAKPQNEIIFLENMSQYEGDWYSNGSLRIEGVSLGRTGIVMIVGSKLAVTKFVVKVVRPVRVVDTIFTISSATFVSIFFFIYGCGINWSEVRTSVKKPVGLCIGLLGKLIIMPVFSYGLAQLLYHDNPEMQLGMFFTGVSSCVNVSNVWVAILNGDINLSIIITIITTIAAFGSMPLWLFTLGRDIFADANMILPYKEISIYAVGIIVPLIIGCIFQSFCRTISRVLAPVLKFLSVFIILYITIFALVVHLYLFEKFSWTHLVAGASLPSLGYSTTYILAVLFKQSSKTALTIAVETGIQNTGIAILLLRLVLPQPESDFVTIIPMYVSTMTPVPLLVIYIYQKKYTKQDSLLKYGAPLNYCTAVANNEDFKGPISMTSV